MVSNELHGEGERIIWSDNIRGDNYKLSFYDYATDEAPERVTLVKFGTTEPYTKIWEYDFASQRALNAAFDALNQTLAAVSDRVDTHTKVKTWAFVEPYPDFTATELKNGVLTATVTKNGTETVEGKFFVINGKVLNPVSAIQWVNGLKVSLCLSNGLQVIAAVGTDEQLEELHDYTLTFTYEADDFVERYIASRTNLYSLGQSGVRGTCMANAAKDELSINSKFKYVANKETAGAITAQSVELTFGEAIVMGDGDIVHLRVQGKLLRNVTNKLWLGKLVYTGSDYRLYDLISGGGYVKGTTIIIGTASAISNSFTGNPIISTDTLSLARQFSGGEDLTGKEFEVELTFRRV